MKLSAILIFGFLAVSLVGTFASTYFLYINSERILLEQVGNHLESGSQLIENSIETFLDAQERKIELIATQSELSNDELKRMTEIDSAFYDLFVISYNGTVIASSNPERIGLDRANRSYFINAHNQTYINPVYFALVPQEYSIAVATPFHGGVLVGSMKISSFDILVSDRTGLGETGETLMAFINEKNETVYFTKRLFSDKINEVLPFSKTPVPMQNALNDNEQLTFNAADYRGVQVISVSNYVERIGVGMVTKIDESEALGVARKQLIQTSVILFLIITFFVLIIGIIISYWIAKPIKKLTVGVDTITRGDLSVQLEKSNISEVQKLTDSLNRILATMKLAILRTGLTQSDMGLGEATKAKEEAEVKYKLMYESSLDARLILEPPKWNFNSGNPASLKMFNLKDEAQLESLTPADLSPKTQPDGKLSSVKAKELIEKAVKNGREFFEWTHKRYNGENFPTNVLLSRFEENGKTYIQVTIRDLSLEKIVGREEKLKKAHKK